MLTFYRDHILVLLLDDEWKCEVTEGRTGEPLPTRTSSSISEGPAVCLDRARELVDLYAAKSPLRRMNM